MIWYRFLMIRYKFTLWNDSLLPSSNCCHQIIHLDPKPYYLITECMRLFISLSLFLLTLETTFLFSVFEFDFFFFLFFYDFTYKWFVVFQLLGYVQLFATSWTAACQAHYLSFSFWLISLSIMPSSSHTCHEQQNFLPSHGCVIPKVHLVKAMIFQ